jgi:hypothetical protein
MFFLYQIFQTKWRPQCADSVRIDKKARHAPTLLFSTTPDDESYYTNMLLLALCI